MSTSESVADDGGKETVSVQPNSGVNTATNAPVEDASVPSEQVEDGVETESSPPLSSSPVPGINWKVEPVVSSPDILPQRSPAEQEAAPASLGIAQESLTAVENHKDQSISLTNYSDTAVVNSVPSPVAAPQSPGPAGQNAVRLPVTEVLAEAVTSKNARVGVEYEEFVQTHDLADLRIQQPVSDIGIHFERETSSLRGTPVLPGDFEWIISGLREQVPVSIKLRLAVIPDPRSLWKDLPSDPAAPFWKRDEQHEILNGEVRMVAASKRGRSHAHDGRFRDDDFALTTTGPNGWHIVAVADGAGSAKFSREGSKIAVDHVIRTLPAAMATNVSPRLNEIRSKYQQDPEASSYAIKTILYDSLVSVGFATAKEVEVAARNAGHDPGDYSTTLIMSATTKTPDGWFVTSFSVGDGGAALLDLERAKITVMTTPDGGEFAGQTRFLRTSEFAEPAKSMERIHFALTPSFTALVLMSDGITDPKFPTDVTMADYQHWKSFWEEDLTASVNLDRSNPAAGQEMLGWMDFWSDGNHDDRTIAVLLP